jgi:hypothetical protein
MVISDHLVRGFEDRLSRAVVLFELYDLRAGKVVLKPENDVEVGPSKRIDALVDVTNNTQAALLPKSFSVHRTVRLGRTD